MSGFKVGDRVAACDPRTHTGLGTIVAPYVSGWDVLLDDEPRANIGTKGWFYYDTQLELIKPDPRDDALDQIAELIEDGTLARHETGKPVWTMHGAIENILRETGRMQ